MLSGSSIKALNFSYARGSLFSISAPSVSVKLLTRVQYPITRTEASRLWENFSSQELRTESFLEMIVACVPDLMDSLRICTVLRRMLMRRGKKAWKNAAHV